MLGLLLLPLLQGAEAARGVSNAATEVTRNAAGAPRGPRGAPAGSSSRLLQQYNEAVAAAGWLLERP